MSTVIVGAKNGAKGVKVQLEGTTMEDVAQSVERLGKLPAKVINGSVRKSTTLAKRLARQYAPVGKTGNLRRGILVRYSKERTAKQGKAVYDVWMDPGMNDVFVSHSGRNRYYYPASIELGFRAVNGGRVPGVYFMKNARDALYSTHEQLVLYDMEKRLDQIWD